MFYVHNYAILYSEIFYKRFYDFSYLLTRFYDFSSHTILRFLYGHFGYDLSTILRSDLTIRFFGALSDPCQNLDFDCLGDNTGDYTACRCYQESLIQYYILLNSTPMRMAGIVSGCSIMPATSAMICFLQSQINRLRNENRGLVQN